MPKQALARLQPKIVAGESEASGVVQPHRRRGAGYRAARQARSLPRIWNRSETKTRRCVRHGQRNLRGALRRVAVAISMRKISNVHGAARQRQTPTKRRVGGTRAVRPGRTPFGGPPALLCGAAETLDQRQLLLPPGDNYFCRLASRADGLCNGAKRRASAGCRGSWSPRWSATGRSAC